jgi:hypothetical protein
MARKAVPVDVKAGRLAEKYGDVLPSLGGSATENWETILKAVATVGMKIVPVPAKKTAPTA